MDAWDHPAPFLHPLRVAAAEIDVLGHANNSAWVHWCQDAAWDHSQALGLSPADYRRLDHAMIVRNAHYAYLLPSFEGEELLVGTWLTGWDGRLQMKRHFQLRGPDGRTRLRGDWELVCARVSSGKPARLPPEFVSCYLPALVTR